MNIELRKAFERLFQLPIGVYWSDDNYMTTSNHFQCLEYRGAWAGYSAAQSELSALREELVGTNKLCDSLERSMKNHQHELGIAQSSLTESHQREALLQDMVNAAEQRNAGLTSILSRFVELQKSDYEIRGGMSTRWQPLIDEAEAALKPTESRAQG